MIGRGSLVYPTLYAGRGRRVHSTGDFPGFRPTDRPYNTGVFAVRSNLKIDSAQLLRDYREAFSYLTDVACAHCLQKASFEGIDARADFREGASLDELLVFAPTGTLQIRRARVLCDRVEPAVQTIDIKTVIGSKHGPGTSGGLHLGGRSTQLGPIKGLQIVGIYYYVR